MEIGAYMGWVTLGAVIVLLAEVFAGRHRSVYKRKGEFPLLGLNMTIGRFVIGPAMAIVIAAAWGHLFPRYRGIWARYAAGTDPAAGDAVRRILFLLGAPLGP